jgi:uncharacterized protein (DUF1800 family)
MARVIRQASTWQTLTIGGAALLLATAAVERISALDVPGASIKDGTEVVQNAPDGAEDQQSLLRDLSGHASGRRTHRRTLEAVRFLEQATWGPTPVLIEHVRRIGFDAFLDEQFQAPPSPYPVLPLLAPNVNVCAGDADCLRTNFTMWPLQTHFFTNALYGEDQLRQRVAFALGQIIVTSGLPPYQYAFWMSPYQQLLYDSAFGNFRTLLYNVTLSPMMGRYLDMVNNRRLNPATGIKPNENYAREILQLFSIGTFRLNQDGTLQLDGNGSPISTYDQDVIEELSEVFTGWILQAGEPGVPNYIDPMRVQVNAQDQALYYEQGDKVLLDLNGTGERYVIPACATPPANCTREAAERDLNLAIDHIFSHPNVAPFISQQLIQKLVTSNPSPQYVADIAAVFDANRGSEMQLGNVVRAILLHDEARRDRRAGPHSGRLTDPVLAMVRFLRAFNATSDGALGSINLGAATSFQIGAAQLDEDVFRAPSVFNFYSPDYQVPLEPGVLGPEFEIYSSMTALRRTNFYGRLVCGTTAACTNPGIPAGGGQATADYRPAGTSIDLTPYADLAADPAALVDALNTLLLHGSMTLEMRDIITNYVASLPEGDLLQRARDAVYLVATSAQFQVER